MRVSELAGRAGVALSAVKFYQREGLLPAGERTAPNQVLYSDGHLQRLRLIRALVETGGLTIAATKSVIAALDAPDGSLPDTFAVAQHAMTAPRSEAAEATDESRRQVLELCHARKWSVGEDNPGIEVAARAIDGLRGVDFDPPQDYLADYARAAETAARADLRVLSTMADPDRAAEVMVVGTVLGDPLFSGLRRLAQQDATTEVFTKRPPSPEPKEKQ
jgi:DNA-binding transcriptional MerR regulator